MLRFNSTAVKGGVKVGFDCAALPAEVNWIDVFRPDHKEVAFLHRLLGFVVPSLDDLSAIETSSRLYRDKDLLFMSMPMIVRNTGGVAQTSPLGLVMSKEYVMTVRYREFKTCDDLHYANTVENGRSVNGANAFITVLETIIDSGSDQLEKMNTDLDALSQSVFGPDAAREQKGPVAGTRELRRVLGSIARNGDTASKISDMLLGMSRMLPFVTSEAAYFTADERAKVKSLGRDIASLNEYERGLTDRVQFLLDATLGLTNIEQNNIFRILTVVSVIGIPPTLVASMYGMNFKNMPELEWTYGYEWGLGLILFSALIPIVWFKWRGWW